MYLKVEMKRVFRTFPVIFVITLFLAVGIGLLVLIQLKAKEEEPGRQKVIIGIVGDMNDSYLGFGIYALENMDSSRYTIRFVPLSEEAAKKQLQYGEISAYLKIPEGFVDSIVTGENLPVTFVSGGSQGGIGTELIREMADAVSEIITESQTGIYTQHDIYLKYDLAEFLLDGETRLNLTYFNKIFEREGMYQVHTVEGDNDLSWQAHYICAAFIIFFMLWGMNGGALLVKQDMAFGKLLAARGMSVRSQTLCEYIAYVCLFAGNFTGIVLLAAVCMRFFEVPVEELQEVGKILGLAVGMLSLIVCIASFQFLLYTLTDSLISGLLLNFIVTIVMGYLSGCFYPLNYMPEIIQKAAAFLPAGTGMEYMAAFFKGESLLPDICKLFLYTVLFCIGAVFVKKRKIEQ